jgi:GPH family glycoside/pentoside/hexuronide:cation symporter
MIKISQKDLLEEFVPLRSRISVTSADAIVALVQTFVGGGLLNYWYTTSMGLEPLLAILVWGIFGAWNMINDPLFGSLSDNTTHQLGRRIPYIRYGGPLLGIFYILAWLPIFSGEQLSLFLQFLITLFLYDTLWTAVATSVYVMPFEMVVSNKARGSIFIWKVFFTVIATLLPLILLDFLKPAFGDNLWSYFIFHMVLGIILAMITFISTFFYKEKIYIRYESQVPFIESLKHTLKNRAFLVFEVVSFTVIYCQGGIVQGLLYFPDALGQNFYLILVCALIGVIIGVFIFAFKGKALTVKKAIRIWIMIFAISCFLILVLGYFHIITLIGCVGIGIGLVGGIYLTPMMNGDVIDYDESITGQRREGMYAGVNSFVTKYATSLAQMIFMATIIAFGYNTLLDPKNQTALADLGVIIGWMLFPTILLFISFIAIRYYPLEGKEWLETKQNLAKVHKEKEKERLEELGYKYLE